MRGYTGEKLEAEKRRVQEMLSYERKYPDLPYIAGVDEVGRGPLAGPVVSCCCILPKNVEILYLNDSKKLSEKRRESLIPEIMEKALAYGFGEAGPEVIDEINILQATCRAMREAIKNAEKMLGHSISLLLNDAVRIPGVEIPQLPIVHGDARSLSIAAASVLAKVRRDHFMMEMEEQYPGYGFMKHKGYGTKQHIEALKELGPCPIHRRSFIKNFTEG